MTQFCWAEVSGSGLTGHEEPVPDVTVQSTVQVGQLGSLLQQAAQLDLKLLPLQLCGLTHLLALLQQQCHGGREISQHGSGRHTFYPDSSAQCFCWLLGLKTNLNYLCCINVASIHTYTSTYTHNNHKYSYNSTFMVNLVRQLSYRPFLQ